MNLEHILYPKTLTEYFRQNWDGESTLIKGEPGKFKGWYDLKTFLRTLTRDGVSKFLSITATAASKDVKPKDRPRRPISPTDVVPAVRNGATVCISQINRADPKLAYLCDRIRSGVGYAGEVHINAYLSPPKIGFPPHFDARSIINMQIHGSKRWWFKSNPLVPWPGGNALIVKGEVKYLDDRVSDWESEGKVDTAPWKEIVLQPGDVLCMPPGVVHAAKAETLSLALNLHFNCVDVSALLGDVLGRHMGAFDHWRYLPPLLAQRGIYEGLSVDAIPHVRQVLHDAIAALTKWSTDLEEFRELLAISALEGKLTRIPVPTKKMISSTDRIRLAAQTAILGIVADGQLVVLSDGQRITCGFVHSQIIKACLRGEHLSISELERLCAENGADIQVLEELISLRVLDVI